MSVRTTKMLFVLIVFIASFLRFARLDNIPLGLSWDEAAIGYNGYGIFTNRRDEWLVKLPVTFKSFGDYKAALAVYLDAGSTAVFGTNPFGIRFPMALAGVLTTVATYFIAKALRREEGESLLAMFLVAISPWNIHYSRMAFESGVAVATIAWGMVFFLWSQKKQAWMFLSATCFALSLYAYHSPKMFLPLLLCIVAIRFRTYLLRQKTTVLLSSALALSLLIPLLRESVIGNASERLFMTSAIVDRHGFLPFGTIVQHVGENILAHADPAFLLFGKATTFRHGNGIFGVLSPVEVIGLGSLLFFSATKKIKGNRWILFLVLAGFFPAVISSEAPHSNRAHMVVPFIQLLSAIGIWSLMQSLRWNRFLLGAFTVLTVGYGLWAIQTYVRIYTTVAVREYQYGYLEATRVAKEEEKNVEKVYFTNAYGQAYIFILLTKRLTPIQFHQGALANYEIREIQWESDRQKKSSLLIGTGKEIPKDAPGVIKEILFPDGEVAFRIVRTENK